MTRQITWWIVGVSLSIGAVSAQENARLPATGSGGAAAASREGGNPSATSVRLKPDTTYVTAFTCATCTAA
jgi:hypothetical protein